jgi:hypothetical protein
MIRWDFVGNLLTWTICQRNFSVFYGQHVVARHFATNHKFVKMLVYVRFLGCGKTFFHNILPQKKPFEFRENFVGQFQRNPDEIRTKKMRQNHVAKRFATKFQRNANEILTEFKRNSKEEKSPKSCYTRNHCKWSNFMVELQYNI